MTTLNPSDRERAATALRFYVERVSWSPGDTERAEFARLLAELEAPPATRETAETFHRASVGVGRHPRGEPTWPEWHAAVPGVTRVENVRTGRRGTFSQWPAVHGQNNPGYAVIEWDDSGSGSGRVFAYAFDLREVRDRHRCGCAIPQ